MSTIRAKRLRTVAVSLGAVVAGIAGAGPAHADTVLYYPDNCGYDEAQFFDTNYCTDGLFSYYHQNGGGGFATLQGDVPDYSSTVVGNYDYDYIFYSMAGTDDDGDGQGIRNNEASVANEDSSMTYTVYLHPDYEGTAENFAPGTGIQNLESALDNNGASQSWY